MDYANLPSVKPGKSSWSPTGSIVIKVTEIISDTVLWGRC